MKLQVKFNYEESYLPSKRHRIPRYREVEGETTVILNEVTAKEAPIAFKVQDYDNSIVEYRLWNNQLWNERYCRAEGLFPVEELIKGLECCSNYKYHKDKETAEKEKYDYASEYLIVDGVVYGTIGEPRYVVMTFGLGHNHGGTSLMLDNYYNSNISKNSYFNALEREEAIKKAKRVAIARGDTKDVDRIGTSYNIEVLIPEAVHCNPQKEHSEGDPFINTLEAITESSSSANESALLGMCVLASEMRQK